MPYQDCRKLLGRFGLAGHAHTIQIKDLSGKYICLESCILIRKVCFQTDGRAVFYKFH